MATELAQLLEQAKSGGQLQAIEIAAGLEAARQRIYHQFDDGVAADRLIHEASAQIDRILEVCFTQFIDQGKRSCSLIAVGGYGRSELLPGSDIDLMILLERKPDRAQQDQLSSFLTFLWDIGLEVGHSVRTIRDCVREGKADITVITTMIESRLITGSSELYDKFQQAIGSDKIWPARKFFEAKLKEQHDRHLRFNDTAYNLEPNIKEGPGGLRDIQIIGWVAKRHFGTKSFRELVDQGFITEAEYRLLDAGQQHLWRVRFALHRIAGRREDRLLFDYQKNIAGVFGFTLLLITTV